MPGTRPVLPAALGTPGVLVRTLVIIRWMSIAGQAIAFAIVEGVLGFETPLGAAGLAILAAVVANIGLVTLYARGDRLVGGEAWLNFAFDILQLGALLYLTGGLMNPFVVLLLVPVTVSATQLSPRATAGLALLATAVLAAIALRSLPLPWNGPPPVAPPQLLLSIFIAVTFTLWFLSAYVVSVALDARRWQQALVVTQAVLERETKMSALGAMAAASAHELGGPLGTISLIAHDLKAALGNDSAHGEDVALLDREARRCRTIMTDLARRAEVETPFGKVSLAALLHEARQRFEASGKIALDEAIPAVTIERSPELLHGLVNLLDNAVRHAESRVDVSATASDTQVTVTIVDNGAGFPPELLRNIGAPYLGPTRSARGGTGLGLFIATTLIGRTGGKLVFRNVAGGGASVEIRWPRAYIDAARQEMRP